MVVEPDACGPHPLDDEAGSPGEFAHVVRRVELDVVQWFQIAPVMAQKSLGVTIPVHGIGEENAPWTQNPVRFQQGLERMFDVFEYCVRIDDIKMICG